VSSSMRDAPNVPCDTEHNDSMTIDDVQLVSATDLKCTKTHMRASAISKNFPMQGHIPGFPLSGVAASNAAGEGRV
jgi:hypothetical protein